jgi:hypothetical protein
MGIANPLFPTYPRPRIVPIPAHSVNRPIQYNTTYEKRIAYGNPE